MRSLFVLAVALSALPTAGWSATTTPIQLPHYATPWGHPYATPAATLDGPLVVLSGVIRVEREGLIGTLPGGMRPRQTLAFRQTKGTYAVRIDVKTNGRIEVDGSVGNWVSLDGLAFTTQLSERLPLASGVQNSGGEWGSPKAWKHNDLVVLAGMVQLAKPGLITILPAHLRPAEHQIFGAWTAEGTARIDAYPNGQLVWLNGGGGRLSLAGINLLTRRGTQLTTGSGYAHYTDRLKGDFGKARALQMGPFTIPSGLLIGLHPGAAVTLPSSLRTKEARLFVGFAGKGRPDDNADVRLDLGPDGLLKHREAGPNGGWLSLAGPVFLRAGGQISAANSAAAHKTLADLKNLDWSNAPALKEQLDDIAAHMLTKEGAVFTTNLTIAEQTVEVVIYRPAGKTKPEVAFLTDELSAGNLITALEGTEIDDFKVTKAAFIFVPQDNARTTRVADLPAPIRTRLSGLTWSSFELVAGQNLIGRLHANFSGTFADIVRETGICGDGNGCPVQVDVLANYGRRATLGCQHKEKRGQKTWRVRLTRPGLWRNVFGISDVHLTNATMEIGQETAPNNTRQKLVRAWSDQATIDDTPYFVFGQCVAKACKAQNAFAIGAASLSLQDYRTLMQKLITRVMGSRVGDWQAGLDRLPLDKVRVEHRQTDYTPAVSVDSSTHNPKMDTMLGYFVGPNQHVPSGDGDDSCVTGTEVYVNGKGVVFGATVGKLTATWRPANQATNEPTRLEADGQISVPEWKNVLKSDLEFSVRRVSGNHRMSLRGQFAIGGLGLPKIRLDVDQQQMAWANLTRCPSVMRAKVKADLDLTRFSTSSPTISVEPDLNASCIGDALGQAWNTAQDGVGVAAEHTSKALLAVAELGAAGISVVGETVQVGWGQFNEKLDAGARTAGIQLSEATRSFVRGAKSAASALKSVFGG